MAGKKKKKGAATHYKHRIHNRRRSPAFSSSHGSSRVKGSDHVRSPIRNIADIPKIDVIPESAKTSLRKFQQALSSLASPEKIDLMVVGAVANAFFGRARYSRDVDVAIALSDSKSREALFSLIKDPRYSITYPDRQIDKGDPPLDLPSDLDRINLVKLKDKGTGINIDVLLVSDNQFYGLDRSSFTRAKEVDLGDGFHTSVASPEDFILMKLVARREQSQDFQDMFMVMVHNYLQLDWPYLHQRAKQLNLTIFLDAYKEQAEIAAKKSEGVRQ